MKTKFKYASLFAAIGLAQTSVSHAALVAYEPFNITAVGDTVSGKAAGASPGFGFTGNWNGYDSGANLKIGSGSLSYGGLATAGNHVTLASTTDGRTGYSGNPIAALNAANLLDNGATLWFSILVQNPTVNTNNNVYFLLGNGNVNAGGNSITAGADGLGFYVGGSGGNNLQALSFVNATRAVSASTATTAAPATSLIVGQYIWGATDTDVDTINLYLPDSSLNQGSVVRSITATIDQTAFDRLILAGKFDSPVVDEIRFGSTYASVTPIPEPSAALLGGLGFLALLRRRR